MHGNPPTRKNIYVKSLKNTLLLVLPQIVKILFLLIEATQVSNNAILWASKGNSNFIDYNRTDYRSLPFNLPTSSSNVTIIEYKRFAQKNRKGERKIGSSLNDNAK